jgi:hypothetical protein
MISLQITSRAHSAPLQNRSTEPNNIRSHRRRPEFPPFRAANSNPQQPTKSGPTNPYATPYKSITSVHLLPSNCPNPLRPQKAILPFGANPIFGHSAHHPKLAHQKSPKPAQMLYTHQY